MPAASLVLWLMAAAADTMTGAAVQSAVSTGSVAAMQSLLGNDTQIDGALGEVWRDTKAYRDVRFRAAAGSALAGPEYLLRIPTQFLTGPLPKRIRGAGKLSDFEPYPVDGRLRWWPVLTLTNVQ